MSVSKASPVKGVSPGKFDRVTVEAAEALVAGDVVYVSTAGEPPIVSKITAATQPPYGVMAEDVAVGKTGVCIRANAIVEVVAGGVIAQGAFVTGGASTAGRVVTAAQASATIHYVLGQALLAATGDGDKINVALAIGILGGT